MKISVIVSVYNRFEYVLNILRCLKTQTVKPYEVIFADDGSKDSLKEFLRGIKRMYFQSQACLSRGPWF